MKQSTLLALALVVCAAPACNGAGPSDDGGAPGNGGAGGGGGGAPGNGGADGGAADAPTGDPKGLARWLGTWGLTSGTLLITCSDGSSDARALTAGVLTFTAGSGADLSTTSAGCTIQFNVSGTTASAPSGQTCPDTANATTFNISSYTFTLGAEPRLATQSYTFVEVVQSATCNVQGSAMWAKL